VMRFDTCCIAIVMQQQKAALKEAGSSRRISIDLSIDREQR